MRPILPDSLLPLLACPTCKTKLQRDAKGFHCAECGQTFAAGSTGAYNFISQSAQHGGAQKLQKWQEGQDVYERWVRELQAESNAEGHKERVANIGEVHECEMPLSGMVLDIGGGLGVTRQFVSPARVHGSCFESCSAFVSRRSCDGHGTLNRFAIQEAPLDDEIKHLARKISGRGN